VDLNGGDPDDDVPEPDPSVFRRPLPPDDRIWRHPSELGPAPAASTTTSRSSLWMVAGFSAVLASALTVAMAVTFEMVDDDPPSPAPVVVREAAAPINPVPDPANVPSLVRDIQPAVVRLEVNGESDTVGSGVLIRPDGHLITNAHVVDQAAAITVQVADGRRLPGTVVGLDHETDVAVVKISHELPFPVAQLGSVDDMHVGQLVIAIGSPLGLTGPTSVTTGVVSGLGRDVQGEDGRALRDLIQTDATIAPGSSGGALFDGRGVMVGITTAFAIGDSGAEGLGFAIPTDVAQSVATDLIEGRTPSPGWLGVRGEDAPGGGALLIDVPGGVPADRARLAKGDVVLEIAGRKVTTMSLLRICLRNHHPDEQVEVVYRRGDEQRVATVTLGRRQSDD
jgi:S1-C subfamily serine protease